MIEARLKGKGVHSSSGKESPGYKIAPLAQSLLGTICGMESAGRVRESLALAYWSKVVGPQAAAATEAESARDGVLIVRTKSSVWSHELTLHKSRILQNLNRALGGRIIKEILYRAQGVSPLETPSEHGIPSAEELRAVTLEPPEQAELSAGLEVLTSLRDDGVREIISRCVVNEARLRHWRIERGWHLCLRCRGAHNTEHDLCPFCRICKA